MKLYNIAKSLILEVASIDSIVDAIKKKDKIIIYYDGDEPGGRGLREIEPVCFGYSKADNPVLRAWDQTGASHTSYKGEQPLPGWRLFRVDKILSFRPSGEKFNEIRPGYNLAGDKGMVKVIINARFDNNEEERLV
jgi:predicted DNA-binding transcriptional regulator YafY